MVNVTLPDDKQNYIHRIGRVGRAERMGLAISLVAKHKEKVRRVVCVCWQGRVAVSLIAKHEKVVVG